MRFAIGLILLIFLSCQKEGPVPPVSTPEEPIKKVLLRDIKVPGLPNPYYHFEYSADSSVTKVSFASGFNIYDVIKKDGRINEMRNTIIVNHDTLRYSYDLAGKMGTINFINEKRLIYKQVVFSYQSGQLTEIGFYISDGHVPPVLVRKLSLTYHADGNLKDLSEFRPTMNSVPEYNFKTTFSEYDDKINVDDFALLHDGLHDHLFLLSGLRLQKNNPRKEVRTGDGANYVGDYTYTYNADHTPSKKSGIVLFTKGPDVGKKFNSPKEYTYY